MSLSECWNVVGSQHVMHGEVHFVHPKPYLASQKKEWDLWVPEGYQIQLSLTRLDINASSGCSQDSLTVRAILKPNNVQYYSTVFQTI